MNREETLIVAVQLKESRYVVPCQAFDRDGLEITLQLIPEVGLAVVMALRDGGPGRRTYEVKGSISAVDKHFDKSARVRVKFGPIPAADLDELLKIAYRRGLCAEPEPETEPARPEPREAGPLKVNPACTLGGFVLRFPTEEERARVVDDILSGALLLKSSQPVEVNQGVAVRMTLADEHRVVLSARVVHVDRAEGRVGLVFHGLLPIVRSELRRHR